MIGFIKGVIISIYREKIVVLTSSGVGYEIGVPVSYLSTPDFSKEREVELLIKTIVREDAIELYGFLTLEEKNFFEQLISISKLGPKIALNILSHMSPEETSRAIWTENISSLTRIPGIGKKTAKRIILELKERLKEMENTSNFPVPPEKENQTYIDALSALKNLGYREEEVDDMIKELLKKEPELMVEEVIRNVLKKAIKSHE